MRLGDASIWQAASRRGATDGRAYRRRRSHTAGDGRAQRGAARPGQTSDGRSTSIAVSCGQSLRFSAASARDGRHTGASFFQYAARALGVSNRIAGVAGGGLLLLIVAHCGVPEEGDARDGAGMLRRML